MEELSTDVVIVGAGPIGIELAVALKKAGVDYRQFDAKQIGHTISWFPPQTRFFSSNERLAIAGVPLITDDGGKSTREHYLAYLRQVVTLFDLQIHTYEPVQGIQRAGGGFTLTTSRRRVRCRRLVLATGGTDRPRKLGVPGEDLPHVHHYFRDPHEYFRGKLLIVGGKNSAVEAALRCYHAGADITLSYRREMLPEKSIKYWLWPEIRGLIAAGRIQACFSSHVVSIQPHAVTLRCGERVWEVPADFVLALIGYKQDNTLFKKAGLELTGSCQSPAYDLGTMETSVKGVYVAGTSIGGTQDKYQVFIENCHVHVDRIVAALQGKSLTAEPVDFEQPES